MDTFNPNLRKVVFPETPLKHMLVDFTGEKLKLNPEGASVTIEMVIDILAEEFPELIWVLAEENFFRGYEQALSDVRNINTLSEE